MFLSKKKKKKNNDNSTGIITLEVNVGKSSLETLSSKMQQLGQLNITI